MSTTIFTAAPDLVLRARNQALWESGDDGIVARYLEETATEFVARLALRPGSRVLDVACGTGNVALAVARAGGEARGLDFAASLVAQARTRAAAEGLAVGFVEGDAEAMPFGEGSFDAVASLFGVMFAPRPDRAAADLLRVCRRGGTVAVASWTPDGLMGEQARIVGRHAAASAGLEPALVWGDEAIVRRRFESAVDDLRFARRLATLRFPFPPGRTVDFLRQFHGPTRRAFGTLDAAGRASLHGELEDLFRWHNRGGAEATFLEAGYLELVATRR